MSEHNGIDADSPDSASVERAAMSAANAFDIGFAVAALPELHLWSVRHAYQDAPETRHFLEVTQRFRNSLVAATSGLPPTGNLSRLLSRTTHCFWRIFQSVTRAAPEKVAQSSDDVNYRPEQGDSGWINANIGFDEHLTPAEQAELYDPDWVRRIADANERGNRWKDLVAASSNELSDICTAIEPYLRRVCQSSSELGIDLGRWLAAVLWANRAPSSQFPDWSKRLADSVERLLGDPNRLSTPLREKIVRTVRVRNSGEGAGAGSTNRDSWSVCELVRDAMLFGPSRFGWSDATAQVRRDVALSEPPEPSGTPATQEASPDIGAAPQETPATQEASPSIGAGPIRVTPTFPPARYAQLLEIKKRLDPDNSYIGQSAAILKVFEEIDIFNQSPNEPLLIVGPTGTGKSEIAELIHKNSRRKGAFLREQASSNMQRDMALTKGRWAGYGANSGISGIPPKGTTKGLLDNANGGTIFLDEVADIGEDFQTFLLDVVDGQPIPRTQGEGEPIIPNVRMIFATNADLGARIKDNRFRNDLHNRISGRTIKIPPLSDRKDDIPLFVERQLQNVKRDRKFLLALLRHSWPSNIRELMAAIAFAKDRARGEPVSVRHLPVDLQSPDIMALDDESAEREVYAFLVQVFESQGLTKGKGLQGRVSAALRVSEATVSRRLERLKS